MRNEDQRKAVQDMANQQQSDLNDAKAHATNTCGRPDSPAQASSGSGASSGDGDGYAKKKLELQRTRKLGVSQYNEANRLWDAGDHTAACQTIRLSAANIARVTGAMKADPALESAFTPVAQHYVGEAYIIEQSEETFCKG